MKTLNEKMAELMGWTIGLKGKYYVTNNDNHEVVHEIVKLWHPDSDLNQAMEVAIKKQIFVVIADNATSVETSDGKRQKSILHNNTPADIARAICEGINEIMGGGE